MTVARVDTFIHPEINGLRLFGEDEFGVTWKTGNIEGVWDSAPTTLSTNSLVFHEGSVTNKAFHTGKAFTLLGVLIAKDTVSALAAFDRLKATVTLDEQELLIDWMGVRRLAYVVLNGQISMKWGGLNQIIFTVPLYSKQPTLYAAGDPLSGVTGLAATSGGMSFPAAFDGSMDGWVFTETVISGEVNLSNPGGAPSPVTLRVDGPVDGPRVEHQQSGGVLELGLSLGSGHYVLFDSQSRQVLIDGRDPARGAVLRRGWSDALPGANTWAFTAAGSSPGARLTVSFRPAYL